MAQLIAVQMPQVHPAGAGLRAILPDQRLPDLGVYALGALMGIGAAFLFGGGKNLGRWGSAGTLAGAVWILATPVRN